MNGYVLNKSTSWRHAMKRSIGPGHKVPLDELYNQYGEKHALEKGAVFVEWLRQIKLKDSNIWDIVYKDEASDKKIEVVKDKKADELTSPPMVKKELSVADVVGMEADDVIGMSVRKARTDLKKITDIKLLRYAYNEARQLANKDTLCIMLKRRIQELELTRR
jgi:hypothetical protein